MPEPIAVYVHIPFCPTKCGYCDFNSYAMKGEIMDRTVEATILEIERSSLAGRPAKTIFFGGGTPTYIPVEGLIRIFETVKRVHPPLPGIEITSEANPGTVDAEKFAAMREAGFNRISLGGQSFLDSDLIRLGRVHRSGEIERAVAAAKSAGFQNINLDLMFGLSGQNIHGWRDNLVRAIELDVQHLSLYCLTIEPNTAYYRLFTKGELPLPEDEDQVEMYEDCLSRSQAAGFHQYEISNFAKPDLECQHNMEYWFGREYAGYGPGAVASYWDGARRVRTTNLKHPVGFCEAVQAGNSTEYEVELLDPKTLQVEQIMLGLRLNQGLNIQAFNLPDLSLEKLTGRGWIEMEDQHLRLTPAGRHFCSEVALELI